MKRDYAKDKCIHELFEEQVETTPDAVAVVFGEQELTYRELNHRANRLANYLRKLGVERETLVGICVERSLEMVVGMVGILKAGGVYAPLDPTYPKERLAFMLDDSGAPVLLTQSKLAGQLAELTADGRPMSGAPSAESMAQGAATNTTDGGQVTIPQSSVSERAQRSALSATRFPRSPVLGLRSSSVPQRSAVGGRPSVSVVRLDTDWDLIALESTENPVTGVMPENIAYVIYTSGSTGQPKGVLVPHQGLCNLAEEQKRLFNVTPEGRVLQFSSPSFDASIFEIVMALSAGATLCVPPGEASLPGLELAQFICEQQVTIMTLPPAALAALPEFQLQTLKTVNVAGEACWPELVARWAASRQFFNLYGPTETTIWATASENIQGNVKPPIGRPIGNTEVYLVDPHLAPVSVGIPGEICIGGDGLARGYLNRPDLTAEKFIPNPFSRTPGARLYKTGDLARRLPDGALDFLGRIDRQVKIRGFRIELEEIERVLNQHPLIQQAAVLADENVPGEKRLVAYVVTDTKVLASTLRSFVRGKLPDYMVPSVFITLDQLPITANGKLDRAALPVPENTRPDLQHEYAAPTTPLEQIVADIWSQVLRIEQIGSTDNFLDLGGNSLKAMQVIARVRESAGVNLFLRDLFEHPTVSELAELTQLRQLEAKQQLTPVMIKRRLGQYAVPLASTQSRIWFVQQLAPENLSYNFQAILRFSGYLDTEALKRTLSELVRRHEIYRTTFSTVDGWPVQIVHEAMPVELALVDLQALSEPERKVKDLVNNEIRRRFDLRQLPLIRWTLFKLNEKQHLLLHVEHHLIHDGWSFNVFLQELVEIYKAFLAGKPSPLAELPIQFADFAFWEKEWLQGSEARGQLDYWTKTLAGGSFVLKLPYDRSPRAVQTFHGAVRRVELPVDLCLELRRLCHRQGITLFMTMLAAFVALMYRYTGQTDICVGSGFANRRRSQLAQLIGMMVNNAVLRFNLAENPTVRELLTQARDIVLAACAHQEIPFDKIVEALRPSRELSHNPLYQVMFSFHDAPMPEGEIPGLTIDLELGLSNGSAKFDLNVIVVPHSEQGVGRHSGAETDGLTLLWEYNTDLFDEATMIRMIGHYQRVLEAIALESTLHLSELPLLTEPERRQLLVDWNLMEAEYPRDRCIHEIFEAHVEQMAERIAVSNDGRRLTYRELNRRANQLAHYLRQLGVGPGTLVGICVERSLEMVIGLLGILKAGAAYVPLDPDYPKERLAFMLEDTGAPVLLTQSKLLFDVVETGDGGREQRSVRSATGFGRSSFSARRSVVCLDSDWDVIAEQSEENPATAVSPDHTAYVIYTSGTTGKPKGVMISHYNVTRLFRATERWFQFGPNDVWAVFHSYAFDFSVWELWGALLYGGNAVIVPYWLSRSPEQLYELLCREQVSVLNQTPSAFRQLIEVDQSALTPRSLALRLVIFGGEALNFQSLKPWFDRHGDKHPQLVNMYGITETTVHVTYRIIKAGDVTPGAGSFIGVPISDLQLYVLDQQRQLLPIGVPGELYVGGAGVGQGYLNQPELTAERFVLNPFHEERPPGKLYKTGDLVRRLSNGDIEYLGRTDHQVKIRGLRVELGEIEASLVQHPGLKEAVVLARDDMENPRLQCVDPRSETCTEPSRSIANPKSDKRLVAYVVPKQEKIPTLNELRKFLKEKLPEYMIPSTFVCLDSLPLSPNGKVDRKALPLPDQARPELEELYLAPRTAAEEIIAGIWAELLKVEKVGIHDNFFDLGGHSFKATQVVSRLRQALQVELPLHALFEGPTVAEMAERVATAADRESETKELALMLAELTPLSDEEAESLVLKEHNEAS